MGTRARMIAPIRRTTVVLGTAVMVALTSLAALADQVVSPECYALVSVANNLYLVGSSGMIITRFTSDGTAKLYATISPDGHQVAYVVPNSDGNVISQYHVANANGRERSFAVNSETSDRTGNFDAYPLVGLWWNANDLLRVTKHVSPSASFFEFHSIDPRLGGWARIVGMGFGDSCVMEKKGGLVSCVQNSVVRVGDQPVFSEAGFPTAPIASFMLTKGSSAATPSPPIFTITVVGVYNGQVGLKVISPNGVWETGYIPNSQDYFTTWWDGVQYGFSANLVDKSTGLVQIQEFQGREAGTSIFDSAIAWEPHGQGLLVIRRENGLTILYLIQPRGRGRGGDGDGGGGLGSSGENDAESRDRHDRHNSWILVAQAPINTPKSVEAMRFLSPSLLLFQTADGGFSWAPIRISNGRPRQNQSSGSGGPSLAVGAVTPLPSTVPVSINGSTYQTTPLDWSCENSRH